MNATRPWTLLPHGRKTRSQAACARRKAKQQHLLQCKRQLAADQIRGNAIPIVPPQPDIYEEISDTESIVTVKNAEASNQNSQRVPNELYIAPDTEDSVVTSENANIVHNNPTDEELIVRADRILRFNGRGILKKPEGEPRLINSHSLRSKRLLRDIERAQAEVGKEEKEHANVVTPVLPDDGRFQDADYDVGPGATSANYYDSETTFQDDDWD